MKTTLLWLAAMFLAVQANAASYGPYQDETYQACGAATSPVAVEIIHGGAWASGYAGSSATLSLCQYLGANGIYAVAVNYRLSPTAPWPAQLQDVQLAMRWLRTRSASRRVGVIGLSAGGHLALFMGETFGTKKFAATDSYGETQLMPGVSDRPDFIVDVSGPTDLTDAKLLPRGVALLVKGIAMAPGAARAFASPIAHLTSTIPPILISHGLQDRTVPVGQSDEFVNAARQAGIPVKSVDSGAGNAVAAASGITYDRHAGGHVFSITPTARSRLFRLIVSFSKGTP